MPESYRATPAPLDAAAVPAVGWWNDFGSPELDRLVGQALAANRDLAAAEARVAQARAQARIVGAARYPSLSIADAADASTGDPTSNDPADARKGSSSATLAAEASYELDLWGKNRSAASSGQALAQAAVFDREALTIATVATTADLYFQILSLDDRIATARQIAKDAGRVLSLVEAQHEVGTATQLQVEQQRTVVAGFEGNVPVLEQQREQAIHALCILLAIPPRQFTLGGVTLEGVAVPEVDAGLPSGLLLRRPDIRAAEERLRAADFDVAAARAALLPSLSLTGSGGVASNALANILSPIGMASGAAALLGSVFDGGRRRGQLRYDKARAEELGAAYQQTTLVALGEVEDALTARRRVAEAERVAVTAVTAAREAARLSEAQFRLGVIDLLTLLDTQRALYQAQDTQLRLRLQRLQAVLALYRALGGGTGAPK